MGQGDPQRTFFYNVTLETFVLEEDPPRAVRPLIDDQAIRRAPSRARGTAGGATSSASLPGDDSTLGQNRRRRFAESGILERLFDETVTRAKAW